MKTGYLRTSVKLVRLLRLVKKKTEKTQITMFRNVRGSTYNIQGKNKDYHKQFCANSFDNLYENGQIYLKT